jgi:hypothetical protein
MGLMGTAFADASKKSFELESFLKPLVSPVVVIHELGHFVASKALFSGANETIVFEYCDVVPWLICEGKMEHDPVELTFAGHILGYNMSRAVVFSAGHISNALTILTSKHINKRFRLKSMDIINYVLSIQLFAYNANELVLYLSFGNDRTDYGAIYALSGPILANSYWLAVASVGAKGFTDFWMN